MGTIVHRMIVAAALLLCAPAVGAQEARLDRLEIVDAGFFTYEPASVRTDSPDSVGRVLVRPRNMRFLDAVPAVTARAGTSFGVRFRAVGAPRYAAVRLRSTWKIPAPGIVDPKDGMTYRESSSEFTTVIGTIHLSGYGFNESWEAVPGVWILEIRQGDRKLLEHSFTIR